MLRIFALIALVAAVSAFVPVSRVTRGASMKMAYSDPIAGALAKAGGSGGWDPLGLLDGLLDPDVLHLEVLHLLLSRFDH